MSGRAKVWGAFGIFLLSALVGLGWLAWLAKESQPVLSEEVTVWLQAQMAQLLLVIFLLSVILAMIWAWLDRVVLAPLTSISRDMAIMAYADPNHELDLQPGHLLDSLPESALLLGKALSHAHRQVKEALANNAGELERLEKVIKHLNVGLIVINAEADILLYNLAAQKLFFNRMDSLGLGRSLYELLARLPLETTMEFLNRCKATPNCSDHRDVRFFCAAMQDDVMLDCVMSLFPSQRPGQTFFLVTFEEVTRKLAALRRTDSLIRHGMETIRSPVANLRAAAETMQHYADMEADARNRFIDVIHDEVAELSSCLDAIAQEANALLAEHWVLNDLLTSDLLVSLVRRLEMRPGPALSG
ncbi:MAG: hypothetical protein HQL94_09600, partial [Magnetococcales bacterium]|nr:hypothetical protein [Magnetococcales bacterium]